MTAEIFFLGSPDSATLSEMIRRETALGRASTVAEILAAADDLHNTVPDHDLVLAVWRQAQGLPIGRQVQVLEELDLLMN